jgi:hypothetical protein
MAIRIQPSRHPQGEVALFDNRDIVAAEAFLRGTPIALSSGEAEEHAGGTTVVGLYGFCTEDVEAGLSLGANTAQVNIAVADRSTIFMGQLISSSTVVAPDIDNVDIKYGLVVEADEWFVDEADTTNVMVQVVDFDLDIDDGVVFFRVLEAALATPTPA